MELQQTYHLHCRQDRNMPPAPAHRENMPNLPQAYRTTANGDPFLVDEEMKGEFFVFASQDALQFLADSQHWYADGTFSVCPEIFFQLYTIHGRRDGTIFPCVLSLLPNKNESTCNRLFEQLL